MAVDLAAQIRGAFDGSDSSNDINNLWILYGHIAIGSPPLASNYLLSRSFEN